MRSGVLGLALAALLTTPIATGAASVEALDAQQTWRLGTLRFEGNAAVGARALRDALLTRPRRWFALWQERPPFDPHTFRTDLDRIRALYRSRGFYNAVVTGDLVPVAASNLVAVTIAIDEGLPVRVTTVDLDVTGSPPTPDAARQLRGLLPLAPGDVFEEERYEQARSVLREWFRQRGYARVTVQKRARVDVRELTVAVWYTVETGPPCVFGAVRITGLDAVETRVVEREVAFTTGEPFRQDLLDKTRKNLDGLRLFGGVRLLEGGDENDTVDVEIALTEVARREVKLGVGYETDEGVRGTAGWRDYNFLGGARQLGVSLRVSQISRTIAADFLQPRFPTRNSRFRLVFAQGQTVETTYTLADTKGLPRLEWDVTPRLAAYGFYRIALDLLSDVEPAVLAAFRCTKTSEPCRSTVADAAPSEAVLSGLGFGLDWNGTDDLVDPSRGGIARLSVEPVGMALGGDVNFVRVIGEGRAFVPLGLGFGAAGRLRIGSQEPTADSTQVPLYERFYAGGIGSVRGYARRRVGPLASQVVRPSACRNARHPRLDCDEPLGGLSLVEMSAELRHPITSTLDVIGFLDAGQVSLASWDFPIDDLQYGLGLGVSYRSVIGPLRVDLGFPLDRRGDDASWQVYLAVGDTF